MCFLAIALTLNAAMLNHNWNFFIVFWFFMFADWPLILTFSPNILFFEFGLKLPPNMLLPRINISKIIYLLQEVSISDKLMIYFE